MTDLTREGLVELAERVQVATGRDDELTAIIRCAIFAPAGCWVEQSRFNAAWCVYEKDYRGNPKSWDGRGLTREQRLGDFLMSVDAAMSAIPHGWGYGLDYAPAGRGLRFILGSPDREPQFVHGEAMTLPRAIVAAALRARAMEAGRG